MHTSTLIKKLARLLEKKANALLKPHHITHAYTFFLMELYQEDGLTQTDLHQRIGIEQPTAVRTLDRMERDGFIARKPSNIDRRVFHIFLTKKGLDYKNTVLACATLLNKQLLATITREEKNHINTLLELFVTNLEEN